VPPGYTKNVDPIHLERFPLKFAVELNKKMYDARRLAQMIDHDTQHGRTAHHVPHSKREMTLKNVRNVMRKAGRPDMVWGNDGQRQYVSRRARERIRRRFDGVQVQQRQKQIEAIGRIMTQKMVRDIAPPRSDRGVFDDTYKNRSIAILRSAANSLTGEEIAELLLAHHYRKLKKTGQM